MRYTNVLLLVKTQALYAFVNAETSMFDSVWKLKKSSSVLRTTFMFSGKPEWADNDWWVKVSTVPKI